jgi:uridylate kinase
VSKVKQHVLSVGGSLIFPEEGLDASFLGGLRRFIRDRLFEDEARQFAIIVGGGKIARQYQDVAAEVSKELTRDDLDWVGIRATHMNAHLVKTLFGDRAHPEVIINYDHLPPIDTSIVVGAGWKPGWSTDYDAVIFAKHFGAKTVINLSNVDAVYDQDPNKHDGAKIIPKLNWEEFKSLVGDEWVPGMNAPFDPIAAKQAEALGMEVVVIKGNDFENLEKYFKGDIFTGTVIS